MEEADPFVKLLLSDEQSRKRARFDVYIGRPSKWGNPFVIGRDGNRQQVIEKYRAYILARPTLLAANQNGIEPR